MKNGYKKLITDKIKDEVNKWIDENENGHCLDSYCSKKPYNESCPLTTLKFGTI